MKDKITRIHTINAIIILLGLTPLIRYLLINNLWIAGLWTFAIIFIMNRTSQQKLRQIIKEGEKKNNN